MTVTIDFLADTNNAANQIRSLNDALKTSSKHIDSADDNARKLKRTTNQLGDEAEKASKKTSLLSNSLKGFAAAGIAGVGLALGKSVQEAIKFESSMADVNKVLGLTDSQLKDASESTLEMSTRLPITANGLAQIKAAAGQAGIGKDIDDIKKKMKVIDSFTEAAAKIGVAFDISSDKAGDALSGLQTIFRKSQKEAILLADSYNHLSNKMDAKASDILSIGNRVGTASNQINLAGEKLAAFSATLLSQKLAPEVISTSLNSMFLKFSAVDKQGKKFHAALSELGLSATQFKKALKDDAETALVDFLGRVKKAGDKGGGIMQDLFGQDHAPKLLGLVDKLPDLENALGLVSDKTKFAGSAFDEYKSRAATTENALTLLKNQFTKVAITLGQAFLPAINSIVTSAMPAIEGALNAVKPAINGLSILLTGLFGKLDSGKAPGWMRELKILFMEFNPLIKTVKDEFSSVFESAGEGINLSKIFSTIGDFIRPIIKGLQIWATIMGGVWKNAIIPIVKTFGDIIGRIFKEFSGGTKTTVKMNTVLKGVGDTTKVIGKFLVGVVKGFGDLLIWGIKTGKGIINWLGKAGTFISNTLGGAIDLIDKGFTGLVNLITGIPGKIISVFTGVPSKMLSIFSGSGAKIIETIGAGIKNAASGMYESVKGVFARVRRLLPFSDAKEGPFASLTKSGMGFLEAFGKGIDTYAPNLKTQVMHHFDNIKPQNYNQIKPDPQSKIVKNQNPNIQSESQAGNSFTLHIDGDLILGGKVTDQNSVEGQEAIQALKNLFLQMKEA